MTERDDKQDVEAAAAMLRIACDHLREAIEAYEQARERGRFTTLPELRQKLQQAWQLKVDAHLVFLETSLSSTIRKLTEYVRYMNEITKLVGRGQVTRS